MLVGSTHEQVVINEPFEYGIIALPDLVRVAIESSTMEIDRDLEMLDVAEAACRFLDPLDRGVDGFHARIRDAMPQIGEHVGEAALDQLRDLRHRSQSAMGGPPEPGGEELLGDPVRHKEGQILRHKESLTFMALP